MSRLSLDGQGGRGVQGSRWATSARLDLVLIDADDAEVFSGRKLYPLKI